MVGRYLKLIQSLVEITPEIFKSLSELVNLYVYAVYSFFGTSNPINSMRNLDRIKKIIKEISPVPPTQTGLNTSSRGDFIKPSDNIMGAVYGLIPKCVAAESLLFIHTTFDSLKPGLMKIFPNRQQVPALVNQFYSTTIDNLKDIRYNIYKAVLNKIISCDEIVKMVQTTFAHPNSPNNYLIVLPNLLENKFKPQLNKLLQQKDSIFPKSIQRSIWDMMVLNIYECMIEAYAAGQSYSDLVRKQMLTDLENIQQIFKTIVPDFQNQYKDYVETYIKSFYIEGKQLEIWLNNNYQTYTYNQLYLLITNGPWDKKTKTSCTSSLNKIKPVANT